MNRSGVAEVQRVTPLVWALWCAVSGFGCGGNSAAQSVPPREGRQEAAQVTAPPSRAQNTGQAPLPPGWVYLEAEGIDTVRGAYHDSASDLFVKAEEELSNDLEPWAVTAAQDRGARSERGVVSGSPFLRVSKSGWWGCDEVTVSFLPDGDKGRSLNLSASLCDATQRERFEGLVASVASPGAWPSRKQGPYLEWEREADRVTVGTAWPEVRARLGHPGDVRRPSTGGGFIVSYSKTGQSLVLRFDATQRLVSVTKR